MGGGGVGKHFEAYLEAECLSFYISPPTGDTECAKTSGGLRRSQHSQRRMSGV